MKAKTSTKLLLSLLLAGASMNADAQQLAFPGAQGWGRFATGGRTGTVYHVTNLNDSGSGSLRDAVSVANRIIVFDVAGVIKLNSRLVVKNNLYLAGQTAPGEGITVYGDGVSFSGASNIIVRYMRFRMGHNGTSGKDCAGIANGYNMIFDHCSFAWGLDETFSINPDGKGVTPRNITLSNSIVGQGLMTHSAGGLLQTDSITIYRTLLCDNSTRNFKIKGTNQYTNNIVYNWKNGAYIMGGDSEGESFCNIESNLFINGPAVGGDAFTGGNANFHFYGNDNWQDSNRDGVYNPSLVNSYSAADRKSVPYDYPKLETWEGNTLIEKLLPTVGASLPYRDYVDFYMIDEVKSFGTSGALISNEESLIYGAPHTWTVWAGNKRTDTDGDGMPDEWEIANGTDPAKNDAMVIAANGYANIENYINSISKDDRDDFLRSPMCVEQSTTTTSTMKVSWRDYTEGEDGFAIEIMKEGGAFTEVARTAAEATSCLLTGLEPGTAYTVRLRAFTADAASAYTAGIKMTTRPIEVGVVDIDTYEPDYSWASGVAAWDFSTAGWNAGTVAYTDNKKVLFAPEQEAQVVLNETVTPETVVVNSDASLVISGTGAIAGDATTVNKGGAGTFTLNTLNTYKGATVLHEGIFELNTLKDGGVASAIGASVEYAQNWIFGGGIYRYTGASTSTNRSAKLTRTSGIDIASPSAVVTMNGVVEGASYSSDFVIGGQGQLKVGTTAFFGYKGATVLRGGTLSLSSPDISKNGIGSSYRMVMAGGHLKTVGENSGYETYSFPIVVEEGTVSQFSPHRNCYINNNISGSGTLQLNIPYLREYIKGNLSGFTGTLIANGVSSEKQGSLLLFNSSAVDVSRCVIRATGNARVCNWETNGAMTLGGLSGTSGTYLSGSSKNTKSFKCTWTVGTANTDETFAGVINNWSCSGSGYTGTVSIIKAGTGLWRLTGNNDYSGETTVNGGTLVVNGTNSGAGKVSVNNEAILAGTGTVAAVVTVNSGGTVHLGDTLINASTLKLTGGLTVAEGGAIEIPLFVEGEKANFNKLSVKGNMKINNGVLKVDITRAPEISDGKGFKVFDLSGATVSGTGFTTIEPERPSDTQVWDTSSLLTLGILYVRAQEPSAIGQVKAQAEDSDAPKYDLNGKQTVVNSGLFIRNGKKYIGK